MRTAIELTHIEHAYNLKKKVIGLLGTKKPKSLHLKTRWGIHTFGMRYPIDVVILDNTYTVKAKRVLQPNRIFIWNPLYYHVLELPPGTIEKKRISEGAEINFD